MSIKREQGLKQIALAIQIENEGVNIHPSLFENLDYKNTYLEQVRSCFDWNFKNWTTSKLPAGFRFSDSQFYSAIYWNPKAELSIVEENGKFFLIRGSDGKDLAEEIQFEKKPKFYNKLTSEGKDMSRIVQARSRGRLAITYSNECSLKDKGLDCLFCNINDTKRRFEKVDNISWKSPNEIAEVVAEGYKEGYHGYNLTGGFVPERREVEYYIDVIEAVKEHGVKESEIHGMACVGAPQDLSIIENYKEAGYQHIATNLEIWDEDLFKYICPGKEQFCGGRENWLKTLKHEVDVFGKGNARCLFVGGLETKESLLEGLETLISLGVAAETSIWKPCIGSALEGHRSPETEWFQDVILKNYNLLKKYGITYENHYFTRGESDPIALLYRLDGDVLPWEKPLELIKSA